MMRFLPALFLFIVCYAGALGLVPQETRKKHHVAAASVLPQMMVPKEDTYVTWKDEMESSKQEIAKTASARAELESLLKQKEAAAQVEKAISQAKTTSEKMAKLVDWVAKVRADSTFNKLVVDNGELQKRIAFDATEVNRLSFSERLKKVEEYRQVQVDVTNHNQNVEASIPHLSKLLSSKPEIQAE